jgi:hypothetical protein
VVGTHKRPKGKGVYGEEEKSELAAAGAQRRQKKK